MFIFDYTITPNDSPIPNPEIPTGNNTKFIMLNNENINNTSIKFVICPNERNNKNKRDVSKIHLLF